MTLPKLATTTKLCLPMIDKPATSVPADDVTSRKPVSRGGVFGRVHYGILNCLIVLALLVSPASAIMHFSDDFESGSFDSDIWDEIHYCSTCSAYAVSIVTFDGDKAARFEHRPGDTKNGGWRAEINMAYDEVKGVETEWHCSYETYTENITYSGSAWFILNQFYAWPDYFPPEEDRIDNWRSPAFNIQINSGAFQAEARSHWERATTTVAQENAEYQKYWMAWDEFDTWIQWDIWFKHSKDDGYLIIHKDGVEKLNVTRAIGYLDEWLQPKWGIYRSSSFAPTETIITYLDNVSCEQLRRAQVDE